MSADTTDAIAGLVSGVESSLADLVGVLEKADTGTRISAVVSVLSSIESALADLVAGVDRPALDLAPLVAAIKAFKPSVTVQPAKAAVQVNVEPTPVTIEAHNHITIPEQKGAQWEVRIPSGNGGRDKVMTITRKN